MNEAKPANEPWTSESARSTYNIRNWGEGYFDVDEEGFVAAHPLKDEGSSVRLHKVLEEAAREGLQTPLLIRFQDILRHRVKTLNESFRRSIAEYDYKGTYRGVFPIKVNQLREVVEEILDAGQPYQFGLEVGSKPELYAGLALQDKKNDLMICNGYKDASFVRMALMGIKLGKQVIIVVEKLEELHQVVRVSRQVGVEPMIGIRVRLQSKGAGKWAESGGEGAKFGLQTTELLEATAYLKEQGLSHCFKLIHFHIGSQIPDIKIVKKAVQEAARFYAKLVKMGFELKFIDVGGGLGVDYDGSRSAFDSSTNYRLQEYTNDVVYYIGFVCDEEKVPHPDIISESGRALVAHHSVLVVEVFGAIRKGESKCNLTFSKEDHKLVRELKEIRDQIDTLNHLEAYHDALERKEEAHQLFTLGHLDLPDKAKIEHLYWEISRTVAKDRLRKGHVPEEVQDLTHKLGDQYLCNFSLFQSLVDHWALGQLFPIMPLQRLLEKPSREATLVDITCDSDGHIDRFIDLEDVRNTLPVHDLKPNEENPQPYCLGFFLMGAYQDIMGDLHNLFGRVNEVHVFLDPDEPEGYYVEEALEGATISESLGSVQYDAKALKRQMKAQIDKAIREDLLKPSEGMKLLNDYEKGLKDYTYLTF